MLCDDSPLRRPADRGNLGRFSQRITVREGHPMRVWPSRTVILALMGYGDAMEEMESHQREDAKRLGV